MAVSLKIDCALQDTANLKHNSQYIKFMEKAGTYIKTREFIILRRKNIKLHSVHKE
jgi:hypothetical protein